MQEQEEGQGPRQGTMGREGASRVMGIPLEVHSPDEEDPLLHGEGRSGTHVSDAFGIWDLLAKDHREEPTLQGPGCAGASRAGPELWGAPGSPLLRNPTGKIPQSFGK